MKHHPHTPLQNQLRELSEMEKIAFLLQRPIPRKWPKPATVGKLHLVVISVNYVVVSRFGLLRLFAIMVATSWHHMLLLLLLLLLLLEGDERQLNEHSTS